MHPAGSAGGRQAAVAQLSAHGRLILWVIWGNIAIMKKKMETLGSLKGYIGLHYRYMG